MSEAQPLAGAAYLGAGQQARGNAVIPDPFGIQFADKLPSGDVFRCRKIAATSERTNNSRAAIWNREGDPEERG
jgi:hypothetical protein